MNESLISLVAVGDMMLGDFPLTVGFGVRSKIENGVDIFKNVEHVLQNKDICFGNLECVLSDNNLNKSDIDSQILRGSPESIDIIKSANFNVLAIANNHIMQHGETAFHETVTLLEQAKILPVGVSEGESGKCVPRYLEVKGLKICFLGYSHRPEKYNKKVLYSHGGKEKIIEQIRECASLSDIVILSLHWGDEFINNPSIDQVIEAHSYVDAGATIILGHHPHILQGVERYKNSVIAYSLGNFVFDFWQKVLRQSMMLCIDLKGKDIVNVDIIPVVINDDYMPSPLNETGSIKLLSKINRLQIPQFKDQQDYEKRITKYKKYVKHLELINKIESRIFFLRNIHRYGIKVAYKSLESFVTKRINTQK